MAKYKNVPFIKVEATQYTEIGYVGRDVESMIKDLVDKSIQLIKEKYLKEIKEEVEKNVCSQIIQVIVGANTSDETFKMFCNKLSNGELDNKEIEIEVSEDHAVGNGFSLDMTSGNSQTQVGMFNLGDMMGKILGKKGTKKIKTNVKDGITILTEEEQEKILKDKPILKEAIEYAERHGVIFIDELDKLISGNTSTGGRGDVSKEGVQRDLLPILDGTTLSTKYGYVKTHHILFITAGAFHLNKFTDLLPELQGRLPVHIKLNSLGEGHFIDILVNKKHSLIEQHVQMMKTDYVELKFESDAIKAIAKITAKMNSEVENTGARRLRTIFDKVLEDLNFDAEKYVGSSFVITKEYVADKVKDLLCDVDLQKFIL